MDKYEKRFQVSMFTHDGKKVASGIQASCLKPYGYLPKKIEWKKSLDFSCDFEIKLTEKNKEEMKAIQELLSNETERLLSEFYDKVWKIAENIMRNYVTPPIKGDITKGKVKWRGLQLVWQKRTPMMLSSESVSVTC